MGRIFGTKSCANLLDARGGITGHGDLLPEGASALLEDNVGQRTLFLLLEQISTIINSFITAGTQLSCESGMLRVYKNRSIQEASCRNGRKFNRKQLRLHEMFLRLPSPFPDGENQTSDQSVWFPANCMQHMTFRMRQFGPNFCVLILFQNASGQLCFKLIF